ncbi:alpha/beta fold hydrolase [Burkholderia vietnamiensis]|jgi:pimeloyl-ACP methyl ester carboxylesterase|uniref:Alpha/beta hydrolase fold protein n=3 Tax=Burkholderia vietnamiensis TaxID=60552 RepID=A4JLC0_BURVG|nr:alpha/beta fold hydrolase [Burkholderia vietnamiensis]ABO57073.1 alpha/beta hydrolase fold protein [Burkholderia vietnamiensis G4]AJY04161.1 alpha/beta hydrolase family protein [Burkholderia vietnamiensis LMG 10929]AOJ98060.1 alpha/beta hydrolase [Burkholderia vietnamiensis]AOK42899.1 alpha/beta hydrolase [Burkholderia vietnamiensis]AVR13505.1 alpha/beta hydrolase [Burkholderia vietnamiensis]
MTHTLHLILNVLLGVVAVLVALALFSAYVAHRVTRAFPPEGRFVDIDGDRLHYVEYGSGPPLVFVHGLAGQWRNFAYLPLTRLAQQHRVILVDRPGAGRSLRGAGSQANVFAQARTIAAFMDALKLERPVLVGHSLGGAIALAVGLNHPEHVSRLALIAPLSHELSAPPGPFKPLMLPSPLVRRFVSWTFAIPMTILTGRKAVAHVFAPDAVPDDFAVKGGGLLGLRPHVFYATATDLLSAPVDLPAMERRYADLTVPVDVLYGHADPILDWRTHGEALAQKSPRVRLKVVEGGHMLPVTIPDATADWLLEVAAAPVDAGAARAHVEH